MFVVVFCCLNALRSAIESASVFVCRSPCECYLSPYQWKCVLPFCLCLCSLCMFVLLLSLFEPVLACSISCMSVLYMSNASNWRHCLPSSSFGLSLVCAPGAMQHFNLPSLMGQCCQDPFSFMIASSHSYLHHPSPSFRALIGVESHCSSLCLPRRTLPSLTVFLASLALHHQHQCLTQAMTESSSSFISYFLLSHTLMRPRKLLRQALKSCYRVKIKLARRADQRTNNVLCCLYTQVSLRQTERQSRVGQCVCWGEKMMWQWAERMKRYKKRKASH